MDTITIEVPKQLVFQSSIEFVLKINALTHQGLIQFDFNNLTRIDPFSLLYVSSEIQRCKSRLSKSIFRAINFGHCTYEAHMGFFKAFGLDYGKLPGEAKGNKNYIPINIYSTIEIIREAKESRIHPAELLEVKAEGLSRILTRNKECILKDTLTYCLREIFRNVIEHSNAGQFGFCAQYLPSLNRVYLAIIDRGIGLAAALSNNPTLQIEDDQDAILKALSPGISGKVFPGQKRKPKGEWANSGYGLFMTSNICKRGGGFFIASGNAGYYTSENKERFIETPFKGTALNLSIDTSRLDTLNQMLRDIDNTVGIEKSKASKSSLGLLDKN